MFIALEGTHLGLLPAVVLIKEATLRYQHEIFDRENFRYAISKGKNHIC